MAMTFLEDIASRLVSAGVGVVGTTIFMSSKAVIPTGPGPFISLLETGGIAPTRVQNRTSAATLRPSVQVVVRASTYPIARTKAKAAYDALDGVFNTTLNGTFYLKITARQEPTDTGLDDAGRPRVTFNLDAEKLPS